MRTEQKLALAEDKLAVYDEQMSETYTYLTSYKFSEDRSVNSRDILSRLDFIKQEISSIEIMYINK